METEAEGKENIRMFWSILNSALREVSGNKSYRFNPSGVMVDEGGGWWASIPLELVDGALDRTISCEVLWKFTVKRNLTAIQATMVQMLVRSLQISQMVCCYKYTVSPNCRFCVYFGLTI